MGIVLALACCAAWGAADFFGGVASSRRPALLVVLLAQSFGLMTALVPACVFGLRVSGHTVLLAGAAGLCSATAFLAFYSLLAFAPMGVVAPVVGTSVVIPMGAGIAQGHWPPLIGMVGLLMAAVGGAVAVGLPGPRTTRRLSTRAKALCFVATLGFGCAITFFAKASETGSIEPTLTMRATSVMLLLVVTVVRWRGDRRAVLCAVREMPYFKVAASGVLDVVGNLCFAVALSFSTLLAVAVLSGAYPLATAALAWAVVGERLTGQQRWGGTAAVFGAALMAVG